MKCRAGDLAIVIEARVHENLGMLVEVLSVWDGRPNAWWVRSLSGPRMRNNGTVASEASADDCSLWPIRGPDEAGDRPHVTCLTPFLEKFEA
jgi:hypothetical protein